MSKIIIIKEGSATPDARGRIEATVDFATTAEVGTGEADALVREYGDRAVAGDGDERPGAAVVVDGEGVIVA